MFDESKHKRKPKGSSEGGQFTKTSDGAGGTHEPTEAEKERMKELGIPDEYDDVVEVDISSDFQKQLDEAETSKERQKIAFRYIMDHLRGEYSAPDGRTVSIERVGADKMTYRDNKAKLRACPVLADMIKTGEYDHSAKGEDKPNKKFEEFAYYKVRVKIGEEVYSGMLNVGIRKDGSCTLYDLRPFEKESKK